MEKEELAIKLALMGKWEEAIEVNEELLKDRPDDVDVLNRLGKAYLELGRFEEAEEAYRRALEVDPLNRIAKKNLEKIELLRRGGKVRGGVLAPELFIEEAGRSCITELINPGDGEVILKLRPGDRVNLRVKGERLIVEDDLGGYIGEVKPKIASRLIKLMRGGNRYEGVVVSSHGGVRVLLREVYRHPSQFDIPSFPLEFYEEPSILVGRFEEEEGGEE